MLECEIIFKQLFYPISLSAGQKMRILGIETSCDETGVAIYDSTQGLVDHLFYSQAALHAQFGGVVPEAASRDHIQKIAHLVEQLLARTQLSIHQIDGIAYTRGPGLAGALLVGGAFARALAFALEVPALGVHHMEGHLLSAFLGGASVEFPFIALLVSGGHTMLVDVKALGDYRILGESLDDAAGEAFDKTAKLLGLSYPGGPALAALAQKGEARRFKLPRPMLDRPGFDFSFSGLKTAVAQLIQREDLSIVQNKADIAASFEAAIVDTLVTKSVQALDEMHRSQLVIAGGVSANQRLRTQLEQAVAARGAHVIYPPLEFCTDNGAMIAYVGALRLARGEQDDGSFDVRARWKLSSLR